MGCFPIARMRKSRLMWAAFPGAYKGKLTLRFSRAEISEAKQIS